MPKQPNSHALKLAVGPNPGSRHQTVPASAPATQAAFSIQGGQIVFSTRYLRSSVYKKMVAKGRLPPSVTTGPVEPAWTAIESLWGAITTPLFDNTPVQLKKMGGSGRWVATTDAVPLTNFDADTLHMSPRDSAVHVSSNCSAAPRYVVIITSHTDSASVPPSMPLPLSRLLGG
jgi:hypothetical protein